jgi:hypothetical protein
MVPTVSDAQLQVVEAVGLRFGFTNAFKGWFDMVMLRSGARGQAEGLNKRKRNEIDHGVGVQSNREVSVLMRVCAGRRRDIGPSVNGLFDSEIVSFVAGRLQPRIGFG